MGFGEPYGLLKMKAGSRACQTGTCLTVFWLQPSWACVLGELKSAIGNWGWGNKKWVTGNCGSPGSPAWSRSRPGFCDLYMVPGMSVTFPTPDVWQRLDGNEQSNLSCSEIQTSHRLFPLKPWLCSPLGSGYVAKLKLAAFSLLCPALLCPPLPLPTCYQASEGLSESPRQEEQTLTPEGLKFLGSRPRDWNWTHCSRLGLKQGAPLH